MLSQCCRVSSQSPPARCTSAPDQSCSRRVCSRTWWGRRHTTEQSTINSFTGDPQLTLFSNPSRIYLTLPSVKFGYVKLQYPENNQVLKVVVTISILQSFLIFGFTQGELCKENLQLLLLWYLLL